MKKIIISITAFLVISIGLLQIDDNLTPETQDLLNQFQLKEHSNAYFYLMGIYAAENEDPLTVGKQVFSNIQKAERTYFSSKDALSKEFTYKKYPITKKLSLPSSELLCSHQKSECLASLFDKPAKLRSFIEQNRLLLTRYKAFLRYDDFSVLTQPSMSEVYPEYAYLSIGQRLVMLEAIEQAQNENYKLATSQILSHITAIRKNLANANGLVSKLVFLSHLSENIDLLFIIANQSTDKETPVQLAQFTAREKNINSVIAKEFQVIHQTMRSLDGKPNLLKKDQYLPTWVVNLLYKPNISLNHASQFHSKYMTSGELSYKGIQSARIVDIPKLGTLNRLRNPLGSMLNEVATPDYERYFIRILDVNTKISLFNAYLGKAKHSNLSLKNTPIQNTKLSFFKDKVCIANRQNNTHTNCLQSKL